MCVRRPLGKKVARDIAAVATNGPGMAAHGIDPTAAWLLWL
jgi:hypothetical protein